MVVPVERVRRVRLLLGENGVEPAVLGIVQVEVRSEGVPMEHRVPIGHRVIILNDLAAYNRLLKGRPAIAALVREEVPLDAVERVPLARPRAGTVHAGRARVRQPEPEGHHLVDRRRKVLTLDGEGRAERETVVLCIGLAKIERETRALAHAAPVGPVVVPVPVRVQVLRERAGGGDDERVGRGAGRVARDITAIEDSPPAGHGVVSEILKEVRHRGGRRSSQNACKHRRNN